MRILHCVEHYPPSVGGMACVVQTLSEGLVRRGHEVTVATSHHPERKDLTLNGVRVAPFKVSGNLVRGLEGEVDAYRRFLAESQFDLIALFHAQQWSVDVPLEMLHSLRAKIVFVPTGFSQLYSRQYAPYFERMPQWLRSVHANVFLSNTYRDIEFARRHGVTSCTVIPNGASEEEFTEDARIDVRGMLGIPPDHAIVLHVGSFTGIKGQREAIAIFKKARLDRAALVLVGDPWDQKEYERCARAAKGHGRGPLRFLDHGSIHVVTLDRPATVAAFQQADVFLFPSNIECSPIVLFEAAAARTPFLSTDVGNAAEIARWTGCGEILPTRVRKNGYVDVEVGPAARQLRRLVEEAPRRRAMAEAGRRAWSERFTWGAITGQYDELYRSLVA